MLRVDSRKVESGDTFLALTGQYTDGHDYIKEAIAKGAACIIANHGEYPVKTIIAEDTRNYLSNYLKELNLEKLEKTKLIGIVGSRGKTVTGNILYQLLNNLNSKAAYIGTGGFYLDGKKYQTSSSTPDIYEIYELINKAIDNGCENIIIEASSRAIRQRHIEGLRFDITIFTNFMPNPEDEDYLNAKTELFKMLKKGGTAIINKSDPYYEYFTLPQNKNLFYGSADSDFPLTKINSNYNFIEFKIKENTIKLPLLASYNMFNYAAAYIAAKVLGFSEEEIISATLALHQVDGRFEAIPYKESLIIIDYAYDLPSIDNILKVAKKLAEAKIITLVGCGGERRQNQRSQIGRLVTKNSSSVIFTTDNPRHENAEDIINDITSNLDSDNYTSIIDRKEAIKTAINNLEEKDILLILGKGHETSQIIGSEEYPFNDREEVMKIIK